VAARCRSTAGSAAKFEVGWWLALRQRHYAGWSGAFGASHFGDDHGSGMSVIRAADDQGHPKRVRRRDRHRLDDRARLQLYGRASDRAEDARSRQAGTVDLAATGAAQGGSGPHVGRRAAETARRRSSAECPPDYTVLRTDRIGAHARAWRWRLECITRGG